MKFLETPVPCKARPMTNMQWTISMTEVPRHAAFRSNDFSPPTYDRTAILSRPGVATSSGTSWIVGK